MENTKLEMFFLNQLGKKTKLVVDSPRADLTSLEVETAMQNIITNNIFNTTGGDLVQISSARVVTTNVNDLIAES